MPSRGEFTRFLKELSGGVPGVLDKVLPLVYDELKALAAHYLQQERPGHTLQTTALVHEAYLRLVDQNRVRWNDRAHFMAVAATVMRRILVDHARSRATAKRGGEWGRIPLDNGLRSESGPSLEVIALDEAMERLAALDPRKSRVVELRFFGGLNSEEAATVLGVSTATVERDWNLAKAWLYREMSAGASDES